MNGQPTKINSSKITFFFLFFLGLLTDAPLFFTFPLLHFFLASLLLPLPFYISLADEDKTLGTLFCLLFFFLGPIGMIGGMIMLPLLALYESAGTTVKELLAAIFPNIQIEPRKKLYDRIVFGQEEFGEVEANISFQDIMLYGTNEQKEKTIEKMLRFFRPEFAPILIKALNNPINAIRVQAAASIASLDLQYEVKQEKYLEECKQSKSSPDSLFALANHSFEWSRSGLVDPEQKQKLEKTAIHAFEQYLRLRPNDNRASLSLARLYNASGEIEKGYSLFEKQSSQPPEAVFEFMETLFQQRDCSKIRALARSVLKRTQDPLEPHYDIMVFWGGNAG